MTSLRELQEAMQAYVIEDDLTVVDAIVEPNDMKAEKRLHIYRKGYYLRLVDILSSDFMALHSIMGEDAFAAMVRNYLRIYPSHYFSVRSVGRHLPHFLENTGCAPSYTELAKFELAFNMALVSEDAAALTLDTLAGLPQEKWLSMTLLLHPSLQSVACCYNTMQRWQALDANEGDIEAVKYDESRHHLLWRKADEVCFCEISDEQYDLLQAIRRGEAFTALCERMLEHFNEEHVVEWVADTLREWINEGLFSGFNAA